MFNLKKCGEKIWKSLKNQDFLYFTKVVDIFCIWYSKTV